MHKCLRIDCLPLHAQTHTPRSLYFLFTKTHSRDYQICFIELSLRHNATKSQKIQKIKALQLAPAIIDINGVLPCKQWKDSTQSGQKWWSLKCGLIHANGSSISESGQSLQGHAECNSHYNGPRYLQILKQNCKIVFKGHDRKNYTIIGICVILHDLILTLKTSFPGTMK